MFMHLLFVKSAIVQVLFAMALGPLEYTIKFIIKLNNNSQ